MTYKKLLNLKLIFLGAFSFLLFGTVFGFNIEEYTIKDLGDFTKFTCSLDGAIDDMDLLEIKIDGKNVSKNDIDVVNNLLMFGTKTELKFDEDEPSKELDIIYNGDTILFTLFGEGDIVNYGAQEGDRKPYINNVVIIDNLVKAYGHGFQNLLTIGAKMGNTEVDIIDLKSDYLLIDIGNKVSGSLRVDTEKLVGEFQKVQKKISSNALQISKKLENNIRNIKIKNFGAYMEFHVQFKNKVHEKDLLKVKVDGKNITADDLTLSDFDMIIKYDYKKYKNGLNKSVGVEISYDKVNFETFYVDLESTTQLKFKQADLKGEKLRLYFNVTTPGIRNFYIDKKEYFANEYYFNSTKNNSGQYRGIKYKYSRGELMVEFVLSDEYISSIPKSGFFRVVNTNGITDEFYFDIKNFIDPYIDTIKLVGDNEAGEYVEIEGGNFSRKYGDVSLQFNSKKYKVKSYERSKEVEDVLDYQNRIEGKNVKDNSLYATGFELKGNNKIRFQLPTALEEQKNRIGFTFGKLKIDNIEYDYDGSKLAYKKPITQEVDKNLEVKFDYKESETAKVDADSIGNNVLQLGSLNIDYEQVGDKKQSFYVKDIIFHLTNLDGDIDFLPIKTVQLGSSNGYVKPLTNGDYAITFKNIVYKNLKSKKESFKLSFSDNFDAISFDIKPVSIEYYLLEGFGGSEFVRKDINYDAIGKVSVNIDYSDCIDTDKTYVNCIEFGYENPTTISLLVTTEKSQSNVEQESNEPVTDNDKTDNSNQQDDSENKTESDDKSAIKKLPESVTKKLDVIVNKLITIVESKAKGSQKIKKQYVDYINGFLENKAKKLSKVKQLIIGYVIDEMTKYLNK